MERTAERDRHAWLAERFDEAQRIAHVGSWEWEVASNLVTWSDEMYRIYGLTEATFRRTYESFLDRVVPDDRERTKQVVQKALESGTPFVYDHRIRRGDGVERVLHTRGDAIRDPTGQVIRLCGACWDVTELREATREREAYVSLLEATLESTADGLLVISRAGDVVAHNKRLLELWRISDLDLLHMKFEQVLDAVDGQLSNAEACRSRVRALAEHPEAESCDVLLFNDGRIFERYSRPQRIGGECVGRVYSYRDVTQRERLLRRALFLSEVSRLLAAGQVEQALVEATPLALTLLGDGYVVELLREDATWQRLVDDGDGGDVDVPRDGLDGDAAIRPFGEGSVIVVPLRARGDVLGRMLFVSRRRPHDQEELSTAREFGRRAQVALDNERLHARTQEALGARDEFFAVAAHEIRGPVTALHLAVQSLGAASPANAERLREIVQHEDRRLTRLVDLLMDVAAIRSGRMPVHAESVDLVELVAAAIERHRAESARKGSTVTMEAPARLVGMFDPMRIDQLLTNLLSNAIRFGRGRPIVVSLGESGGEVWLAVRDQGIGIEAEALARIFDPFERAVPPRHYGGLGLGLYIVSRLVRAMNGSVAVESSPGAGAVFTVRLPLRTTS
jgi:PAS domain S-box-containing protein